ncbi:MAG TPA: DUF1416 domain-containing protein [Streptosporangiaceae bacterium]|nr:DUF1416 domain-containing protein [Streptosporangiaceae bacterium]
MSTPDQAAADGCGAPAGGVPASAAAGAGDQAVVEGRVLRDSAPVSTGYARLLGTGDEFVAEVPLGEDGGFRFFAAPGTWTIRVLAPGGARAERSVSAEYGKVTKVDVTV